MPTGAYGLWREHRLWLGLQRWPEPLSTFAGLLWTVDLVTRSIASHHRIDHSLKTSFINFVIWCLLLISLNIIVPLRSLKEMKGSTFLNFPAVSNSGVFLFFMVSLPVVSQSALIRGIGWKVLERNDLCVWNYTASCVVWRNLAISPFLPFWNVSHLGQVISMYPTCTCHHGLMASQSDWLL